MPHDVFVSYSSKDKPTADALVAVLERHGIRCWVAPRDIAPGTEWGEAIINGINGSGAFVLVFSGSANDSPQIKREVERAVNRAVPIIPFRIEQVAPSGTMEYFISTPHWLDAFTPPLEKHLEQLVRTLRGFIPESAAPVATAAMSAPVASAPLPVASGGGSGKLIAAVVAGLVVLGAAAWAGVTYFSPAHRQGDVAEAPASAAPPVGTPPVAAIVPTPTANPAPQLAPAAPSPQVPPPLAPARDTASGGLSGTWARDIEPNRGAGVERLHRELTFSSPGSAKIHDDVTVTNPGRRPLPGCDMREPNSGRESYDVAASVVTSDDGMITLTQTGDRAVSSRFPSCWRGYNAPMRPIRLKWDGQSLTNAEGYSFTRTK